MIDPARELLLSVTVGRAPAPVPLATLRARAPGVLVLGEAIDASGRAVTGGLADPSLFGACGDRFARIVLVESVAHPLIDAARIHELPVLPPALRGSPGGPGLRSSLEMLYTSVLSRNHRLAKAISLGAPAALLEQERRALGRAISQLFANRVSAAPQRDLAGVPRAGLLELGGEGSALALQDLMFALGLEA